MPCCATLIHMNHFSTHPLASLTQLSCSHRPLLIHPALPFINLSWNYVILLILVVYVYTMQLQRCNMYYNHNCYAIHQIHTPRNLSLFLVAFSMKIRRFEVVYKILFLISFHGSPGFYKNGHQLLWYLIYWFTIWQNQVKRWHEAIQFLKYFQLRFFGQQNHKHGAHEMIMNIQATTNNAGS